MIKKCLFPVAGYGTRFLPATKAMPKEMLPVVAKPLVQYGVEEAAAAGLVEIGFVTGRGKRAIEDHFDLSYELEDRIQGTKQEQALAGIRHLIETCTFSYTRQLAMKGPGHAILNGRPLIGDEPFGVVLADDLCYNSGPGVLAQMLDVYARFECSIVAIEEVSPDATSNYGIVAGESLDNGLLRVHEMVEKPDPSDAPGNLAIIGRYILTPDIFDTLQQTSPDNKGEVQITDALRVHAREGRVIAMPITGRRFDCGSLDGYMAASVFFYDRFHGSPQDTA